MPKKTTKKAFHQILEEIQWTRGFDGFRVDTGSEPPDDSVVHFQCEAVKDDMPDVRFVATLDGDNWTVEDVPAP